jgi:hypothetical protein
VETSVRSNNYFFAIVSYFEFDSNIIESSEEYQGIRSPVTRSEVDFDPGAKYHIAANVEYIRYDVMQLLTRFRFKL